MGEGGGEEGEVDGRNFKFVAPPRDLFLMIADL